MTHQNLRLGKCWKLFRATLNTKSTQAYNHFGQLTMGNMLYTFCNGCSLKLKLLANISKPPHEKVCPLTFLYYAK